MTDLDDAFVGFVIRPCCRKSDDLDVAQEFVSAATFLLIPLSDIEKFDLIFRLRLQQYQRIQEESK